MRELPRVYHPIDVKVKEIPTIIYPLRDTNRLEIVYGTHADDLVGYVTGLIEKYPILRDSTYTIVFLWVHKNKRMADVWLHQEDVSGSFDANGGAVVNCFTFCEHNFYNDAGIASTDTLPILGAEIQLRRDMPDLEDYVHNPSVYPSVPGIRLVPHYGVDL